MTTADGAVVATTKVLDHGPPGQRWNLVIVGDGYRAADLPKYYGDVDNFVRYLYGVAPFNELWAAINVYRVDVTSTDSGADDPGGACGGAGTTAATYFDSTFCSDGVTHRLLAGNDATASSVAKAAVAQVHVTLVMVNSPDYGGAGGPVAWCSAEPQSAEIAIHEIGHTFFGLEDEYGGTLNNYAGAEPVAPNVTKDTTRATTKWRAHIAAATVLPTMSNPSCALEDTRPSAAQVGTVGLFEGGGYANCGLYRPEYDCRMRTLGRPFCTICQQRIRTFLAPFGGAMSWQLNGNGNTNIAHDFVGTTDRQPLAVRTDGSERLRVSPDGNVGIATVSPNARLSVVAPGATQIAGTARSSTLLASAGDLGKTTNTEIALATLGFTSANNTSLGIRARRTTGGTSWQSTAIGLGVDVDNTVRAGACMWLHGNGNTGIGTDQPSAGLSVVAPGATEIAGTARSSTLLTSTGALGSAGGSEVALATLGFSSGNDSSLGIRARRTTTGAGWQSTAIGLGMGVDNTVRAGASMWLHGNGNTGIGTDQPGARLSVVAPGATEIAGTARSSTLLTSTGALGSAGGSEVALATLGFSSGNNSSLGIRARRTTTGASWQSTAIGLGMDVDNTVQAGASMWLHGNGNVGIGSTQPPNARLSVNSTAPSSPAMSVASSGNVSALFSESTGGAGESAPRPVAATPPSRGAERATAPASMASP